MKSDVQEFYAQDMAIKHLSEKEQTIKYKEWVASHGGGSELCFRFRFRKYVLFMLAGFFATIIISFGDDNLWIKLFIGIAAFMIFGIRRESFIKKEAEP